MILMDRNYCVNTNNEWKININKKIYIYKKYISNKYFVYIPDFYWKENIAYTQIINQKVNIKSYIKRKYFFNDRFSWKDKFKQ